MKALIAAVCLLLAEIAAPTASIPYFAELREVAVSAPQRQNYILIDEPIWQQARLDLGDLRLYAGERETPYALIVQRASSSVTEQPARLLDLGSVRGRTQFLVDVGDVAEYDRVTLQLSSTAKNFIARAIVEGSDDDHRGPWAHLATCTLYDFSRENLGGNSLLKLPLVRFHYLRIAVSGLTPAQITGANTSTVQEQKAAWAGLAAQPKLEQAGRTTVISWPASEKVPLERVAFQVAGSATNFRRPVEVSTRSADGRLIPLAHGAISRLHITRGGRIADSEELAIDLAEHRSNYQVTIQNGDDPPLPITGVQALALERRLYFDAPASAALRLYYGDAQLTTPSYDYAKFFQPDSAAPHDQLGPVLHNAAYTGRPDQRPWSERHAWLLWSALVFAVVALGAVALRGLKTT